MDVSFESFPAPQLAAKRSTKREIITEQVGYRGKISGIPDLIVKSLDKAWNTHVLSYLMQSSDLLQACLDSDLVTRDIRFGRLHFLRTVLHEDR